MWRAGDEKLIVGDGGLLLEVEHILGDLDHDVVGGRKSEPSAPKGHKIRIQGRSGAQDGVGALERNISLVAEHQEENYHWDFTALHYVRKIVIT